MKFSKEQYSQIADTVATFALPGFSQLKDGKFSFGLGLIAAFALGTSVTSIARDKIAGTVAGLVVAAAYLVNIASYLKEHVNLPKQQKERASDIQIPAESPSNIEPEVGATEKPHENDEPIEKPIEASVEIPVEAPEVPAAPAPTLINAFSTQIGIGAAPNLISSPFILS